MKKLIVELLSKTYLFSFAFISLLPFGDFPPGG